MKKFICAVLSTVMIVSGAFAVSAAEILREDAELRPDITIVIDDETCYFRSASGDYIYPILFNDTTYLPLRSIGEIMGKNVNWDEANKTITLSGERDNYKNTSRPSTEDREDIEVQVRKDFKIVIDNKEQTFKDAKGSRVYPILFDGSTYLPLRAIGEIMDCDVEWDGDDKTVTLNKDALTVTDADTFESKDNKGKLISGLEDIKKKILEDAGIKKGSVKFVKVDKDYDDGIWKYEIDFVYDGKEYEYEIEVETGKILSRKTEKSDDGYDEDDIISADKARSIAAKDAGLNVADINHIKTELDRDDGETVYEIEFKHKGYEYEYKINAETGDIISKDIDKD